MSPTNASGGPSVAPQALLWSYELSRENNTLIEHIEEVESQLLRTEEHSRNLEQYLKSLTNLVAAFDVIKGSNNAHTEERLRHLHEQLKNTALSLCESDQTLADKNKALLKCIAELDKICSMPEDATPEALNYQPASVTDLEDLPPTRSPIDISIPLPLPTVIVHAPSPTNRLPSWLIPEITMTLSSMSQNNRSLEAYYDEANYLRRQSHSTHVEDEILVRRFISGCDDRLYRRRLDHAVRNGQMNWTRLSHEIQHLLNEEEYMENQKFALAHRNEDGSVLWPDGSVRHRFIAYLPFTEDDLTTSEDNVSSSEDDSKAKSI
ncbi:hypothetical protein N7476_011436 [Penicillium atrosanguineum]|uniref:Uncharacterized protein n=1 Tax=Penicillium atrosanguineum TaxID=1132637 RepID=A0A9W9PML1_9EURO|nr:hypothetical protein N7526_010721 [Penicillium atrosanguineum]KAJ5299879.1 hypothetical protein N7476_011436 [Penicillium atrosanguineum]